MPPELIGLHRRIVCACPRLELLAEIERPRLLPVVDWHIDAGEGILHIAEPFILFSG